MSLKAQEGQPFTTKNCPSQSVSAEVENPDITVQLQGKYHYRSH